MAPHLSSDLRADICRAALNEGADVNGLRVLALTADLVVTGHEPADAAGTGFQTPVGRIDPGLYLPPEQRFIPHRFMERARIAMEKAGPLPR